MVWLWYTGTRNIKEDVEIVSTSIDGYQIFSNFANIKLLTPTMNFLHYLYVKAKSCHTRLEFSPRLAISWPLWTAVLIFTPLDMLGSIWNVCLVFAVAYLTIDLLVLAVYPPKLISKNYGKWRRRYNLTSSLWFYLYFCSPFAVIAIKALFLPY